MKRLLIWYDMLCYAMLWYAMRFYQTVSRKFHLYPCTHVNVVLFL